MHRLDHTGKLENWKLRFVSHPPKRQHDKERGECQSCNKNGPSFFRSSALCRSNIPVPQYQYEGCTDECDEQETEDGEHQPSISGRCCIQSAAFLKKSRSIPSGGQLGSNASLKLSRATAGP